MNAQLPTVPDEILSAELDELLARAGAGEAAFLRPSALLRAACRGERSPSLPGERA